MGALNGIRVVDFGQWISGPLVGMLLADQGAEVIHIDPPGGPRWQTAANATLNRGKTNVVLDLMSEAGRSAALRLIGSADIVVENFRPGVMGRLRLDATALLSEDPRLIYCSIPGFATDDPRAMTPGWEGVVAAATGSYPSSPGAKSPPRFTALPIASGFGALAAAVAIVMALVARQRDGLGQYIEVPLFDATFLAIGASGLLVDGRPAGGRPDDPWGGMFECSDGAWVRINLATPRFLRRFLEAAGKTDWIARGFLEEGALAAGTALRAQQQQEMRELFYGRTADEWEALGRLAQVPLTRMRTSAEWAQTEHAREAGIVVPVEDPELGKTLQPGPAVRLEGSPGQASPRKAGEGRGLDERSWQAAERHERSEMVGSTALSSALEGIRVVDITQVLAGPTSGRTLAEFGAEVVKINNPREEGAGYRWSVHRYHTDVNRGKKTILLDLKTRVGLDVFWRLVDHADVVIQNFRLGVAERLGIGYEQVKERRPDVIYGSVSMYGRGGAWGDLPGYEVNAQAVSGMVARAGGNGQPFAVNDYSTGLLTAFGIGMALLHRLRTGQGQLVEGALARTATVLQTPFFGAQVTEGTLDGKESGEGYGAEATGWGPLQRLYRAADGWFFLGAKQSQLSTLADIAGLEGIDDLRGAELEATLTTRFAGQSRAEWIGSLSAAGVGAHAVVSATKVMTDHWVVAHGLSLTRAYQGGSPITTIGPPARLSRTPVRPGALVSPPGGDAAEVLESIGMGDRLADLVANGVIALE